MSESLWKVKEILQKDLSGNLNEALKSYTLKVLDKHKAICFKGQNLTDTQFRNFALLFGSLEPRISAYDRDEKYSDLHLMTNVSADGTLSAGHQEPGNRFWHTDKSYKIQPSFTTILYAIDVPAEGGETEFCNLISAYEDLPKNIKKKIEGLQVRHDWAFAYDGKPSFRHATGEEKKLNPPVSHPLVRRHPKSGKKSIYIGFFAADIVGMSKISGRALLDELTAHATQDRHVTFHQWNKGDVVIWDNSCLMHRGRPYDAASQARTLLRAVIQGQKPN